MAVGRVGLVLGFIAAAFVLHATAQTVHTVGDTTGWMVPPRSTFYSDWAANKNFAVGDSLGFNFTTNSHDVLKVSKNEFDGCQFDDADDDIIRTGPATVRLNNTGRHYFVCTIGPHCSLGQKLSINVVSSTAGGPMSPSSPSPPSSTPPPSPSSSNGLMASLFVTFSAIAFTLF